MNRQFTQMKVALVAAILRDLKDWKAAVAALIPSHAGSAADPNLGDLYHQQRKGHGKKDMSKEEVVNGAVPAFQSG
jgi:hypothetical protein